MLAATGGSSGEASKVPSVSAIKFRHSRADFFLVDIREPEEISQDPVPSDTMVDATVPLGRIFYGAKRDTFQDWKNKRIVVLCASGRRAQLAAKELHDAGFDAAYLARGMIGLKNPAAAQPDFVVVLGTKSSAEKLTLALNASAVAAEGGDTVVLALMGEGVCTFLRKGNNKEEANLSSFRVESTFVGEPFKPCHTLLSQFLDSGNGVILGCTSCIKARGFEFGSDMLDPVQPMQMPDLLRMLSECSKSLQFM